MNWDKKHQVRHAAICCWPKFMGRTIDGLQLCQQLNLLGYTGSIGSLHAEAIIHDWQKAGWIDCSPDGIHFRLSSKGREQFATWQEEDRLWSAGGSNEMPMSKRLVDGEPAQNLRKINAVIGSSTVIGIHDPYTKTDSLKNILILSGLGTTFSASLRFLSAPGMNQTESISLITFLKHINAERSSNWEIRIYSASSKPHRRFLVCGDGSVVTCGMSLNKVDKDETLDRFAAGSDLAKHDCELFEDGWKMGTAL